MGAVSIQYIRISIGTLSSLRRIILITTSATAADHKRRWPGHVVEAVFSCSSA